MLSEDLVSLVELRTDSLRMRTAPAQDALANCFQSVTLDLDGIPLVLPRLLARSAVSIDPPAPHLDKLDLPSPHLEALHLTISLDVRPSRKPSQLLRIGITSTS